MQHIKVYVSDEQKAEIERRARKQNRSASNHLRYCEQHWSQLEKLDGLGPVPIAQAARGD